LAAPLANSDGFLRRWRLAWSISGEMAGPKREEGEYAGRDRRGICIDRRRVRRFEEYTERAFPKAGESGVDFERPDFVGKSVAPP
jgi:hypothetical protein